jgi:hypothetical protein
MNMNKDRESRIIEIIYEYEDYLSDGYGYYCRPQFNDADHLVSTIAKKILTMEPYTMSSRVRSIVRILKTYEDHMSDGFGYYYYGYKYNGLKYKSELQLLIHIAEEIVREVLTN